MNSIRPLNDEMKVAWNEFKSTKLFGAIVSHIDPKFILENEGFLWCIFYNGFLAKRNCNEQKPK